MFAFISAYLARYGYEGHLKMKNQLENFMGSAIFWRTDEFTIKPNIDKETGEVNVITNMAFMNDGKKMT